MIHHQDRFFFSFFLYKWLIYLPMQSKHKKKFNDLISVITKKTYTCMQLTYAFLPNFKILKEDDYFLCLLWRKQLILRKVVANNFILTYRTEFGELILQRRDCSSIWCFSTDVATVSLIDSLVFGLFSFLNCTWSSQQQPHHISPHFSLFLF